MNGLNIHGTTNMDKITWKTEKKNIKDLIPADYNPRKITEDERKHLETSLEKFGLAEIPVVNTNNNLIAGHQRVSILKDIHNDNLEIDVRVPSRLLTINEEKEYNIRSNRNTGTWDKDLLQEHFTQEDLLAYGFEEFELQTDTLVSADELLDENWSPKEKTAKTIDCPHCGENFEL